MGSASFHPSWWSEKKHGGAWQRVKEAMKRDLEQTKNDFTPGAPDLRQDVGDTINQAAGKVAMPPPGQKTPPSNREVKSELKRSMKNDQETVPKAVPFDDVEGPLSYGYAARIQYAAKYPTWDDKLETTLREEWTAGNTNRDWDEVAPYVRRGFDAPHKK